MTYICIDCCEEMIAEKDDCEPIIIHRCPKCGKVKHEALNGYEG